MKKRFVFVYILIVLIPLVIMDAVAFGEIIQSEQREELHEMENLANAVIYTFEKEVDSASKLAEGIYTSKYVYDFINREFESPLEYYSAYKDFFNDTLVELVDGQSSMTYTLYLDNDTITNGSQFQKLERAQGNYWYKYIVESGLKRGLIFDYGGHLLGVRPDERKVYFFQILDFYDHGSKNVLLIELDYSYLGRSLKNLNYEMNAYICDDELVLLSNGSGNNVNKNYRKITTLKNIGYTKEFQQYNQNLQVKVKKAKNKGFLWWRNWAIQIIALAFINVCLPIIAITRISKFFYNYRLREQEMIVTRQHAELLALHSQINPHFLFNALESIRMHSIIKKETETAEMVEKLAKLQRQYTEWNEDNVYVEKEVEFAENYLGLQKYRFGDRLSYSIEVDEHCKRYMIPKLTLVTFVENACVHGIESKNKNGWIFVRIHEADEMLTVEIEDTGNGMTGEETEALLDSMRNADMNRLKEKGRVGVVNACLRLKMLTDNEVKFDLESEEGVGTIVTFRIPVKNLIR